jgi:hypothetical protein
MQRARHTSRPKARALRGFGVRLAVMAIALAFAVQSFVVQIHIHGQPAGAPVAVDLFDGNGFAPAKDGKAPKNDEGSCPLCQAFAAAGNFVTPAAAAILLPAFSVSIIDVVVHATHVIVRPAHNWRGRAPPRA